MRTKFLVLALTFIFLSCHKHEEEHSENQARHIRMAEIEEEIYLPTTMWDKVTGAGFEKSVQQAASFNFTNIEVILEEKTKGVLTEPLIRIEFPNAGGEIDLSRYTQGTKGTFRVKFIYEGLELNQDLQIFYVSKAKKRRIENEIYGSGCKEYFDIKDYILKVNSKEGIEVNVTRDRHVSVLAGHFVFTHKKDKQTFLSQVTFTDSKRKDLLCEESRPKKPKERS